MPVAASQSRGKLSVAIDMPGRRERRRPSRVGVPRGPLVVVWMTTSSVRRRRCRGRADRLAPPDLLDSRRDRPLRQIGTLPKELDPKVFADYLLTLGMKTRVDERPEGWIVWIYNEDHVARARDELQGYLSRPDDPRYRERGRRRQGDPPPGAGARQAVSQELREVADLWGYPGLRRRPLTVALVAICVVVFLLQQSTDRASPSRAKRLRFTTDVRRRTRAESATTA